MFNFAKKPTIGGTPAIEKSAVIKIIANILFDLANKTKSAKSLFCFFSLVFFRRKNIKTDQMKTLNDFNFNNKKALIRVDFNVPQDENKKVTDNTRIVAAKPTIDKILNDGGSVIIMTHLGRPKGKVNPEFSLSQMSFDLKIPERFLSNYFNKDLNITFSEWRKNLRIDYVCRLIEAGESKNLTIEAIATNAGFASRSKFIDAFKERKGVTPSAFIKSISSKEA